MSTCTNPSSQFTLWGVQEHLETHFFLNIHYIEQRLNLGKGCHIVYNVDSMGIWIAFSSKLESLPLIKTSCNATLD